MENINIDLKLNVIKPLHAQWLVDIYNYSTTADGRQVIFKG